MAFQNLSTTDSYDALLSTTLRNYRKKLEDNVFRNLPLLFWLQQKGRKKTQDGGYEIMIPLLYGVNDTVKMYSGYDQLDTRAQDGITTARYQWKQMAASITISREEERKNSGPHKIVSLLEAKTMQAEKTMQLRINNLLHGRFGAKAKTYAQPADDTVLDTVGGTAYDNSTGSAAGFNSLDHFVRMLWGYYNPASSTARSHKCGGITTSFTSAGSGSGAMDLVPASALTATTNPWWINYSIPGFPKYDAENGTYGTMVTPGGLSGTTETDYSGNIDNNAYQNLVSVMRTLYNRISDGSEHPDVGLTSQEVYEGYEGALMPLERFQDTKVGDAGFQNLRFKGMTLMHDHGITTTLSGSDITDPTSTPPVPLYMLNSEYLNWVVDSQTDFMTTPFFRPPDQDARVAQILLMAQLTCSNRQKQGVISCALATDYSS